MGKKRTSKKLKVAAGLAAAAVFAAGSVLWVTFGNGAKFQVQPDFATKIIDGDTFYTSKRVRVRLDDLDAPEIDRCGGKEAKKGLEKLILNKPLYVEVRGQDQFSRDKGYVYTDAGFVNLKMIERGFAYYKPSHESVELKAAVHRAKSQKKGIFGPKCTQMTNLENPICNIKGNVEDARGSYEKIFITPSCRYYNITTVDLYKSDRWFCTEQEAQKAGFKKPKLCP